MWLIKSEQKRKRNTSQPLPLCSYKEYRGSAQRARGLKRPAKARAKSPPLSGGEVARKTEEKGRGLSERSEFRRPRRRLRRRTQKPDNSGGASWFVLLAAEKNEQRSFNPSPQKQMFLRSLPYILRCKTQGRRVNTFNSRNRVVYLPLPFAVSRSLTGCGS